MPTLAEPGGQAQTSQPESRRALKSDPFYRKVTSWLGLAVETAQLALTQLVRDYDNFWRNDLAGHRENILFAVQVGAFLIQFRLQLLSVQEAPCWNLDGYAST